MNSNSNNTHIEELVSELLDGGLTQEQRLELLAAMHADEQIAKKVVNLYIDSCVLEALHAIDKPESFVKRVLLNAKYIETGKSFTDRVATAALKQDMIEGLIPEDKQRVEQVRRLAERQLKAFLDQQEQETRRQTFSPHYQLDLEKMASKARSFIRYTKKAVVVATVSVSIIFLALVGIQYALAHRVVATLGQTTSAQWDKTPEQIELRPGWMKIEQGYASIRFKKGAEVILQAPCVFDLKSSNRMFLESGWITAKVPEQARGFTVKTAASSITDYGTEFGLMVGAENSEEVHVFEGTIGLKSAYRTGSQKQQEFKTGEAATIDTSGHIERTKLVDRPNLFVRTMPTKTGFGIPGKRISLADIVGGGNGLNTGFIGQGLDPSTGQITQTRKLLKADSNEFHAAASLPFVDGLFVPDANNGPVVISSTGLLFEKCPATCGLCYESITNGAVFRAGSKEPHEGRLKGRTYNTMINPSISMHPNAGITFDLGRIRSSMPEVRIVRFKAICGISDTVVEYFDRDWDPNNVKVDFWILVDGKIRFGKKLAAASSMTESIDIPLNPGDRFLTLATTNPGDYLYCWGMFAKPELELKTMLKTVVGNNIK
jgi:hypothetical protein